MLPDRLPSLPVQLLHKRTSDADLHAASLSHWQQRYEQMSAGAFCGEVQELLLDCNAPGLSNAHSNLQIFQECANRATSQRCQLWEGGFWVGLAVVAQPHHGLRFMGRALEPQTLMTSPCNGVFDLQVPAGCALYGIVLPRNTLAVQAQQLLHGYGSSPGSLSSFSSTGFLPAAWADAPRRWQLSPLHRLRLAGLLREIFCNVQSNPGSFSSFVSARRLHTAVCTVLCEALQAADATLLPTAPGSSSIQRHGDKRASVARACDWALAHSADAPDIAAVCQAMHTTRRTLQNSFHEVLGISPAVYLRSLRLNQVRRALCLQPRPGQQTAAAAPAAMPTIADIASQWGFWHLGHFCQAYKALFGETPSQTRNGQRTLH